MPRNKQYVTFHLRLLRILYLSTLLFSCYLLSISRFGEVYTVWQVAHPLFIPAFAASTWFLLMVIFSSDAVEYKLFFIMLHSVLSHSLMVILFPAGSVGVQQTFLGQTRLVFDNVITHGFGWSITSIPTKAYYLLRGENLQAAFSVILARMFGVDVYWTHLLLVPLMWGIFVPVIAFLISKRLGASERVSVLSSLLVSLFPTSIVWSRESIPNGLSYLFFFCFIYFVLRYLKFSRAKDLLLVVVFFLVTSLSHYLAGTMAFSIFLIANTVKTYENDKRRSPNTARLALIISFIFCVSILPFALAYRRLFYPWADTHFSLQPFYELSPSAAFFSVLLGNYFDFISREAYITTVIFGIGPLVGLIGMAYALRTSARRSSNGSIDPCVLFLSLGVALIVINDRILKLFMTNVPFVEADRLWMFRDFLLVSFAALFIVRAISEMRVFLDRMSKSVYSLLPKTFSPRKFSRTFSFLARGHLVKGISLGSIFAYVLVFTIVSSWVTASIYYAYPHWAPLQTTSYELEAAKYIDQTTKGRYIVVCDQWMIFAGQMIAGINNPKAFYFFHTDPHGISLFIQMKTNPTNQTLTEAMKTNNATVAYFIIEKPRLGTETYNNIINKAQQNHLQTHKIFYYPEGEEKLRMFLCLRS